MCFWSWLETRKGGAAYGDISLFTSLEVLTRIQREMNTGTGLLQLNIEVVRPGTISALKLHLDRTKREKGPGYFHLVHFDLHGIVDKRAPSGSRGRAAPLQ